MNMWCEIGGMVKSVKIYLSLDNQDANDTVSMGMGYVLPESHREKRTWSLVFSGTYITSKSICKV